MEDVQPGQPMPVRVAVSNVTLVDPNTTPTSTTTEIDFTVTASVTIGPIEGGASD
jgi:hypothetical protein